MVVFSNETAVRVGGNRGQIWVTRTVDEAYHKDCVDIRYRGYTEMQFRGCYTAEMVGPCYMFRKETASKRRAAQDDLNHRNSEYLVQQRVPKPEGPLLERNKNTKGGIDWYRYQTCALIPRLIPFCKEVIERYGECFPV